MWASTSRLKASSHSISTKMQSTDHQRLPTSPWFWAWQHTTNTRVCRGSRPSEESAHLSTYLHPLWSGQQYCCYMWRLCSGHGGCPLPNTGWSGMCNRFCLKGPTEQRYLVGERAHATLPPLLVGTPAEVQLSTLVYNQTRQYRGRHAISLHPQSGSDTLNGSWEWPNSAWANASPSFFTACDHLHLL